MADSDGKYTKVEREVLEILDDIDTRTGTQRPSNVVEFRRPRRKKIPRVRMPDLSQLRYALSPAKMLIIMFASILGALFLQSVPFLSPILIVVAIVAFAGIFFAKSRPSAGTLASKPGAKRWRGRDIDLSKRR
jgi:hypothetical protein